MDAQKIAAARRRARLTQVELGIKAGLHPATISLAERGVCSPATAAKIMAVLGAELRDRPEDAR